MQIQLASDLHLDFLQHQWPGERLIDPVPGADVVVLAGDIAGGDQAFGLFADWTSPSMRLPIIMVAGNHEFYGHAIEPMRHKMKETAARHNIHFLENESVVVGDTRFLGATLWTDYQLRTDRTQEYQMKYAQQGLNDHLMIRTGRHTFTAQDALDRHVQSRAWLVAELAKPWDGKTVVVTHHGPHPLSVHPSYANDVLSSAFVSDLSEILFSESAPDRWLHGHTHDGFDYMVGHTRVVANPAGYILNRRLAAGRDDFRFENQAFDSKLLIEV
jgi:predicted phosphohydrolase